MNDHYGKFEYKGLKYVGLLHKPDTPTHFGWKNIQSPTPVKKIEKYLSNIHKIEGAHPQYMNSHLSKFE